jgi:hypothetical protein
MNRAWSSSKTIILSLDASFLQTSHPAGITRQSDMPHQQDFIDLHLDLDFDLEQCLFGNLSYIFIQ